MLEEQFFFYCLLMTLMTLIKHPPTLSSRPHRCVAKISKIRENQWLKKS